MSRKPQFDAAYLRSRVTYDHKTGEFIWMRRSDVRESWNTRYAGRAAGYDWALPDGRKYRSIRVNDWPFLAHVLAFLYVTGEWPDTLLDHADNDGLNNKWSNIRPANKCQNGHNSKTPKTNTSGLKGASWSKGAERWRATIRHNGRQLWIGYFDSAQDAHAAYAKKATELRGEFARTA